MFRFTYLTHVSVESMEELGNEINEEFGKKIAHRKGESIIINYNDNELIASPDSIGDAGGWMECRGDYDDSDLFAILTYLAGTQLYEVLDEDVLYLDEIEDLKDVIGD